MVFGEKEASPFIIPAQVVPQIKRPGKTFESMDNYLSTISNVESELKDLTSRFKYYMKRYLMHPRNKIPGWNEIEVKHVAYFQKLRDSKRAISPEELSF